MRLTSISYREFDGQPLAWTLQGLELDRINLIVGRNASGKTRTLNLINGLANILAGTLGNNILFVTGHWEARLSNDKDTIDYRFTVQNSRVVEERVVLNGKELLIRGPGGAGKIYAEKLNDFMEFQTPDNQAAVVARQDALQHTFIQPLHDWGEAVRYFHFGSMLGRDVISIFIKNSDVKGDPAGLKDTNQPVATFRRGVKELGQPFVQQVVSDMVKVGFDITEVKTGPTGKVRLQPQPQGELAVMLIREIGVDGYIEQTDISQGMFRCLSTIVQINYFVLSKKPSCLIIDDVGEGLDFERSQKLIALLMEKALASDVQLILSTNDRLTMNAVPLQYWSLLRRSGGTCTVFNYKNSRKAFDNFSLTGLNNFDFFASDFISDEGAVKE